MIRPVIYLTDNDIILKLAQCNLLTELPEIIGRPAKRICVTPTARYQLLPKTKNDKEKWLKKRGDEATLQRVRAFLETAVVLEQTQNVARLAQFDKIDGGGTTGESLLFAAALEIPESLVFTGDKNALKSLLKHQAELYGVVAALTERVITFECAILLAITVLGRDEVIRRIQTASKFDRMLTLAMRNTNDLEYALKSYSNEVIDFLAFKARWPN